MDSGDPRHPDTERLQAFSQGRLGAAELADLQRHLDACASCCARLTMLADDDPFIHRLRRVQRRPGNGDLPSHSSHTAREPRRDTDTSVPSRFLRSVGPDSVPQHAGVPTVPGYEILGELGRGGMGIVYQARQLGLQRLVALKMLLAGSHATPDELARFRSEAEAVARLRHENIVQIHDIGSHAGLPYFALEFCDGGSLAAQIDGQPQVPREAARLVEAVARGVEAAHQLGIIHRDLKPANILLAVNSSPLSVVSPTGALLTTDNGQRTTTPKIADFGLAKWLERDAALTGTNAIIGTPSYMAPEQAGGHARDVGPAADVYALGAILYELLTGRPPFKARSQVDTLMLVVNTEAPAVSQLQPNVPRDLAVITMKCLEKLPARRYVSAQALADDLGRFREGRPVQARAVSRVEHLRRWTSRNPVVAGLAAGLFAVLLAGIVGVSWKWREAVQRGEEAEDERTKAVTAQGEAERERNEAQAHLYAVRMNLARVAWEDAHVRLVQELLELSVPQQPGATDLRGWEWYYLNGLCHDAVRTFTGHTGVVHGVAFSPDDRRLATAGQDGTVRLWDPGSGAELATLRGHDSTVESIAFSPDGTCLVSGSHDRTVRLWDVASGRPLHTLRDHAGEVYGVAYSPDGKCVASGSTDGTVKLWDPTTGHLLRTLPGMQAVWAVAFHPDGTRLAAGGADRAVRVWDVASGQLLRTWKGHAETVNGVTFSPDGWLVASSSPDRTVRIWNVTHGNRVDTLFGHGDWAYGVAFSPDARQLATVRDATVRLWDVGEGQVLRALRGHSRHVRSVAFSAGGQWLATAGADGTAQLWDANSGVNGRALRGHTGLVSAVAFDPNGRQLASTAEDGTARLWDMDTVHPRLTLRGHTGALYGVAFHPEGRELATAGKDKTVRLWRVADGGPLHVLRGHDSEVMSVAYRPHGRRLASAGDDGTIRIWDADEGRPLHTLRGHTGRVWAVAFTPDGQRLASAGADQSVRLWDPEDGRELQALPGHQTPVRCVAFSLDGTLLASGAGGIEQSGEVKLWDVQTGRELRTFRDHDDIVLGVAFSPDGTRLASASVDGTVKLWHVATGQALCSLRGEGKCNTVAFSCNGIHLATGTANHTIMLWSAQPWTAQVQVERETQGLIDYLLARPLVTADIRDYVAAGPALSPAVREQAILWAGRDLEKKDAAVYALAAFKIVSHPHLNATQYDFALRQALTACRLAPSAQWHTTLRGAALYRLGRYTEAVATLTGVPVRDRMTLACLAMAEYRLGQTAAARATLSSLVPKTGVAEDGTVLAVWSEAQAAIARPSP